MNSIIKKLAVLAIFATFFAAQKTYTTQEDWFQTWDRPEYVEWAAEIPEGYELHIISAQESDYLVVKANLLMGSNGLPGFEVIEQVEAADEEQAFQQIKAWRDEYSNTWSIYDEEL